MKDSTFGVLVDAIKVFEQDSGNVKNSIKDMIDHFKKDLTEEQKNKILTEYMEFEKRHENKEKRKVFQKRLEEERYKEMLNSFLNEIDEAF